MPGEMEYLSLSTPGLVEVLGNWMRGRPSALNEGLRIGNTLGALIVFAITSSILRSCNTLTATTIHRPKRSPSFIAGTDPSNSSFCISMESDVSGVVLSWNAVSNRAYGIWHSSLLGIGFTHLEEAILYLRNSYTDAVRSVGSADFYRVDVQQLS